MADVATPRPVWHRPLRARDPGDPHRGATPLELFFDLCFVVAVALAAAELHHAVSEDHVGEGVLGFTTVFFAIWWAWVNFTWFSSAFDPDDGVYRLTTMVQMGGGLVLAAGVPAAMTGGDFGVMTLGYVVMRLALVGDWLRVAWFDPGYRRGALRFAAGIALVQVAWIVRLFVPGGETLPIFVVLVAAELLIPVWGERPRQTAWHPGHITERYGLFTIIVLGETVLAATTALHTAFDAEDAEVPALISLAAAALVIVFALWWLYFDEPGSDLLSTLPAALRWSYGHYFVFAAAAAVGAGLQVAVDHDTGHFEGSRLVAGYAVALPVAVFLLAVWLLLVRGRPDQHSAAARRAYPAAVAVVLTTPFLGAPVHLTALVLAGLVAVGQLGRAAGQRRGARPSDSVSRG